LSDSRRHYEKAVQRLDITLARFKLTGMGRPEEPATKRTAASSAWSQVASK
jgi:hypothetical protein